MLPVYPSLTVFMIMFLKSQENDSGKDRRFPHPEWEGELTVRGQSQNALKQAEEEESCEKKNKFRFCVLSKPAIAKSYNSMRS